MDAVATSGRKRKDPKRRPVSGQAQTFDGTPGWTTVVNGRPDRVYKLIYKGGGDLNQVPRYLDMGYVVELWGDEANPNRLKFRAGATGRKGEQMEHQGHVLMSISAEDHAAIEASGDGQGGHGQTYVDQIEKAIRRGTGVANPLRGRVGVFGGSGLQLGPSMAEDGRYEELEDFSEE